MIDREAGQSDGWEPRKGLLRVGLQPGSSPPAGSPHSSGGKSGTNQVGPWLGEGWPAFAAATRPAGEERHLRLPLRSWHRPHINVGYRSRTRMRRGRVNLSATGDTYLVGGFRRGRPAGSGRCSLPHFSTSRWRQIGLAAMRPNGSGKSGRVIYRAAVRLVTPSSSAISDGPTRFSDVITIVERIGSLRSSRT